MAARRVGGVRVVSVAAKIVWIFVVFLLVSNFASNYINLVLNRGEQTRLANALLVEDLRDILVFANNQFEIARFADDQSAALIAIERNAANGLGGMRSVAFAVQEDGNLLFSAGTEVRIPPEDGPELAALFFAEDQPLEGPIDFSAVGFAFFGVYRFNETWDAVFVRADELGEFNADSLRVFTWVSIVILSITLLCTVVGVILIRYILRFVGSITESIMDMQAERRLGRIDLSGAPNDEVTYLGAAFNSLSSSIDNLITIFRKFVAREVAQKAYEDGHVQLEGRPMELAILFSDIRGFTHMTETLGTDIITLLNLHYDRAIRHIHANGGDVGSIIGDAVLALFGHIPDSAVDKALHAIRSGYLIQQVAAELRDAMYKRREQLLKESGGLTEIEEQIFRAVLVEVGVGIDGGEVFYGNIGSTDRMVNTVIGDTVNTASRLESLTKFYRVPLICSERIKRDAGESSAEFRFVLLDCVRVQGKSRGENIYWPVSRGGMDPAFTRKIGRYREGVDAYLSGDWETAHRIFSDVDLPVAQVMAERTTLPVPENWSGEWAMTGK